MVTPFRFLFSVFIHKIGCEKSSFIRIMCNLYIYRDLFTTTVLVNAVLKIDSKCAFITHKIAFSSIFRLVFYALVTSCKGLLYNTVFNLVVMISRFEKSSLNAANYSWC